MSSSRAGVQGIITAIGGKSLLLFKQFQAEHASQTPATTGEGVPTALPTSANKAKGHLANPGYVPHGADEDSDRIKTNCCVSVQYPIDTRNNITVTVHAVSMRYNYNVVRYRTFT